MQTRKQMQKHIYMLMLIYQDKKNRIHSRKNEPVRTSVRVEGLKTKHPKSFQFISSWKPQHSKSCLFSKELNPNVDKRKNKIKSRGWMSQWGRVWGWKALKTGGRAFLSAQRACVHRSTMIFVVFVFVLFCFVFALRIFLQRCKKELLQVNRVKSISSMG